LRLVVIGCDTLLYFKRKGARFPRRHTGKELAKFKRRGSPSFARVPPKGLNCPSGSFSAHAGSAPLRSPTKDTAFLPAGLPGCCLASKAREPPGRGRCMAKVAWLVLHEGGEGFCSTQPNPGLQTPNADARFAHAGIDAKPLPGAPRLQRRGFRAVLTSRDDEDPRRLIQGGWRSALEA